MRIHYTKHGKVIIDTVQESLEEYVEVGLISKEQLSQILEYEKQKDKDELQRLRMLPEVVQRTFLIHEDDYDVGFELEGEWTEYGSIPIEFVWDI